MAEVILFPWEEELQDPHDLTPFVERVEKMEDLCGVRISGISAYYEGANKDGIHSARVMAEVTGLAGIGHVLDTTVTVQCVAYDAAGRVVAEAKEMLWQGDFRGLHAISFLMFSQVQPERFVLFPRR